MKATSVIRQSWVTVLAVIAVIFMAACGIVFQGCSTVQVKPMDSDVRNALLTETGFTLAFYALSRESDEAVARVEKSVAAAKKLLKSKDVKDVTKLVLDYISDFPQWKTGNENYDVLISRTVNVLSALIEADLTVPAKYQDAKDGIRAFLTGAGEGIEALHKARAQKATA